MHHPLSAPLLTALALLACAGAPAQSIYRSVGPDGKVSFSDRPPNQAQAQPATSVAAGPASANAPLPYELRQIASRFPVTIYIGNDCAPCVSLRNMLAARGVPFTERSVSSNEDIAALQRLSGSSSLPFGSIGGQQLSGYADTEWTQYLDAAGYPQQSQLPANYRQPASTPLVAVKTIEPAAGNKAAPARRAAAERPSAPVDQGGPTPGNPAGIRF